ncbi:mesaconyl-C4 CoA hydratase [Nocardioides allogilvus]|uniref:mesaconyl-C4 CoA hydratase n=1 Tax=Nocardioides allogilvus TaxID=2072017 RepID=UPI000D315763|nr:mesaconyl-C4 CoA hydratase [Nocardioides allogilvus]
MSESANVAVRTEVIGHEQAEALAHLLGTEVPEYSLPPLWHWTYLLDRRPHADLGPDGHPTFGIPAPPGPGRKRMFAGGTVSTYGELIFGRPATRTTSVAATREKQGRTGPLTFVTVRNEYAQDGRILVVDENDIVYRSSDSQVPAVSGPAAGADPLPASDPSLTLTVDEALLFRFSALTYNAHRIHYDHTWARMEGYTDLVVHGPLQALMMGELHRRAGAGLVGRMFSYRLVSPMVGPQTFTVAAAQGGLDAGAEVRDAHDTTTAVSTVGRIDPVGY